MAANANKNLAQMVFPWLAARLQFRPRYRIPNPPLVHISGDVPLVIIRFVTTE